MALELAGEANVSEVRDFAFDPDIEAAVSENLLP